MYSQSPVDSSNELPVNNATSKWPVRSNASSPHEAQ